MEKNIWVIGNKREELINAQRCINSIGSMKAVCILSDAALEHHMTTGTEMPSLIIIDYEMEKQENGHIIASVMSCHELYNVPVIYLAEDPKEVDSPDAVAVILKPFTPTDVCRIEKWMWQFEIVRQAEKTLEIQTSDIIAAREIRRLNEQLSSRNELLYRVFGRYFSDDVMSKILENGEGALIGGDKTDMTVMCADLRGFTAMSATMDSDRLLKLLNHFFTQMTEIINRYSGVVIELPGDGILAVFGAPIKRVHHPERAITAAIAMQNRMKEVNEFCRNNGYRQLSMGIAIHSGVAFIGNIGSEKVMRYNVIGRVVNECSRMEGYCAGGRILVSEHTIKGLDCRCKTGRKIDITAKGIHEPIAAYEILSVDGKYRAELETEEYEDMYETAESVYLELYSAGEKKISEASVRGTVVSLSDRRIIFRPEKNERLSDYTDYKIKGTDITGKVLFNDIYGKIFPINTDEKEILFTYTDEKYTVLMDEIKRGNRV